MRQGRKKEEKQKQGSGILCIACCFLASSLARGCQGKRRVTLKLGLGQNAQDPHEGNRRVTLKPGPDYNTKSWDLEALEAPGRTHLLVL